MYEKIPNEKNIEKCSLIMNMNIIALIIHSVSQNNLAE